MAITAANESLQPFVDAERRQFEQQRDETELRQRARAILDSRDYSFCLFPRTHFERLLLGSSPRLLTILDDDAETVVLSYALAERGWHAFAASAA